MRSFITGIFDSDLGWREFAFDGHRSFIVAALYFILGPEAGGPYPGKIQGHLDHGELRLFNLVLIYNPFGPKTLERVLLHIEESLARNPRKIRIVYVNPAFNALFEKCAWLVNVDTRHPNGKYPFIPYTTFWKSKMFFLTLKSRGSENMNLGQGLPESR